MPEVPRQEDWMSQLGKASGSRASFNATGDKWGFRKALMSRADDRDLLFRYTRAEVGGQGPQAKQAFMEMVTNMADSQRKSIREVLHAGNRYFPGETHSRAKGGMDASDRAEYNRIADKVQEGSNISNYATGNASWDPKTRRVVGFGGGPTTAIHSGEHFGIEKNKASIDWARSKGYTGDLPIATSEGYEGGGAGKTRPWHRSGKPLSEVEERSTEPTRKPREETPIYVAPQREFPVADMVPRMRPI